MSLRLPAPRTLALLVVLIPLLGLFAQVALRSGPLAPIPVTVAAVEQRAIAPALFGIGTVEARFRYPIGPVVAGRVLRVEVDVGEGVQAGQLLGEIDPVDLDQRVIAQEAAQRRADAAIQAAEARVRDGQARREFSAGQVRRYEQLLEQRTASEDTVAAKRQEAEVAAAGLNAALAELESARQEQLRVQAEREALVRQRANLRLLAPVDGLVVARHAEPGGTLAAGQPVVEVIDPASLWVNARFDQLRAAGLAPGLKARIALRAQPGQSIAGTVARVEPLADAVTEELLAKITFDALPEPLPRIGELAEATLSLPALPAAPALPNAALHRVDGRLGVWLIEGDGVRFAEVRTGATDLEGWIQIAEGLAPGQRVALHSLRALVPIAASRWWSGCRVCSMNPNPAWDRRAALGRARTVLIQRCARPALAERSSAIRGTAEPLNFSQRNLR
jgi:HlyD family secretion protein